MPKLLIICSQFYPHPSVAAVRMTEWSRFLPRHGWSVVVVTRSYGYTATADSLAAAVHRDVEVKYLNDVGPLSSGTPGRPNSDLRWRQRLGASHVARLVVPDLSVFFWRAKRTNLESIVRETRPDVLLTSSPPHSVHGAGLWLTERTGIPWVADFRDPYLFDPRYRPKGIFRIMSWRHRRYERMIYQRATRVVHAIPAHARWAAIRYPRARLVTLTNGSPPELLDGSVEQARAAAGRKSVRIVGVNDAPEVLSVVLAIRSLVDQGMNLELRIVGQPPSNHEALQQILGDRLVLTGPRSHPEALREVAGADVLVAPVSIERSRSLGLSSKLFEYAAAARPVILINPTLPDEELAAELPCISILRAPSPADAQRALAAAFSTDPDQLQRQRDYVDRRYRRDDQVAMLAAMLDDIVRNNVRGNSGIRGRISEQASP